MRYVIKSEWRKMLQSDDPEVQNLALQAIKSDKWARFWIKFIGYTICKGCPAFSNWISKPYYIDIKFLRISDGEISLKCLYDLKYPSIKKLWASIIYNFQHGYYGNGFFVRSRNSNSGDEDDSE